MWNTNKCTNIFVTRVLEGKERGAEKYLKKYWLKLKYFEMNENVNIPNLM